MTSDIASPSQQNSFYKMGTIFANNCMYLRETRKSFQMPGQERSAYNRLFHSSEPQEDSLKEQDWCGPTKWQKSSKVVSSNETV